LALNPLVEAVFRAAYGTGSLVHLLGRLLEILIDEQPGNRVRFSNPSFTSTPRLASAEGANVNTLLPPASIAFTASRIAPVALSRATGP
jgi:hypothetical protein